MSRGPGRIQNTIQEAVEQRPHELHIVRLIASRWADKEGVEVTAHLHASFRRAASRLCDQGTIKGWGVLLPTHLDEQGQGRDRRRAFCVSSNAVTEVTPEQLEEITMWAQISGGLT